MKTAPLLAIAILLTLIPGCGKNRDETLSSRSVEVPSGDDGSGDEPDYAGCLNVFDYIASQCGAQFYDSSGRLMTQNDLVKACGSPKVACAVECYNADKDCEKIRSCLTGSCGLK